MKPNEFWDDLERVITAKTKAALTGSKDERGPTITYLREIEEMARRECDRRRTVQIIASARRVLGDRTEIGPKNGPYTRTLGDLHSGQVTARTD